jgi:DNA modification methylase
VSHLDDMPEPLDVAASGRYTGDCRELLARLPEGSVQTCVTSPPYWGLRDYGVAGQLGLERTPEEYVAKMVEVFRGVRRALRDDGTLWLNLGDSYAQPGAAQSFRNAPNENRDGTSDDKAPRVAIERRHGLKPKDLVGIPWLVAFALRADGWYLRSDIIWHKPNPMPESVTDRPTKAHEYVFLMSKSARYYYDADAIREPASDNTHARTKKGTGYLTPKHAGLGTRTLNIDAETDGRNCRSVWSITPRPYKGAHFATMPPPLAERCILAGSRPGDVVLDPFFGSGTTGMVAQKLGRKWIGFDLNPAYEALQRERIGA